MFLGGAAPILVYAVGMATRPRGVRFRKPCMMRKGSWTSSSVEASSPTATATDERPTGPPLNL